jgi:hypothetical protein
VRGEGFRHGILRDLKVYHASGPHCNRGYWELTQQKIADARETLQLVQEFDFADTIPGFTEYFEANYRKSSSNP